MGELNFELRPVKEKPRRRSKYDAVIDEFLKFGRDLVEVELEGVRPQSLRLSLYNRLKIRGLLDRVKVFQRRGKVYLERLS